MAEPLVPPLDRRASATARTWDTTKRQSLAKKYIDTIGRKALLGTEVDYHAIQMHDGVGVPESKGLGKNNASQVRATTAFSIPACALTHSPPAQALKSVAQMPRHGLRVHQYDKERDALGKGKCFFFDMAELTKRLQKAHGVNAPTKGASTSSAAGGVGGRGGGVGDRGRGSSSHGGSSVDRGTSAGDSSSRGARTQQKRKRSTNAQRKSAVVSSGTAVDAAVGASNASALNDEDEVEVEAVVEERGNGDGSEAGAHAPASAPAPLAVLQQLEDLNFGAPKQGGLVPRISALEAQEFGAPRQGNVKSRVQALRDHFTAEIGA